MPDTTLLAKGNPIQVGPAQSELAQLDVSSYRGIRLSAGNWAGSPGPVVITITQVDQPNTPNANFIAGIDAFVQDRAWGHHASCTCAIGPREENGVLDKDFRVHGTRGLRVVDASVFPRIPGFFIVSAIYMIGEKAADVILADK